MVAVLKYFAMMAVMYVVMKVIENPFIKAIIQVMAMMVMGYIDTGSIQVSAMMLVEATGTYLQGKIAQEMIKLETEMKEFREMVNSKQKEMDKMKKEVGMDDYNAEWMLYIASLAPVENPEDFFERALNTDLNKIEVGMLPEVENDLPTPQR